MGQRRTATAAMRCSGRVEAATPDGDSLATGTRHQGLAAPASVIQGPLVATTCIAGAANTFDQRLAHIKAIIGRLLRQTSGPFLMVLPSGFLSSGPHQADEEVAISGKRIANMLTRAPDGSAVCLGIDGRNQRDQLGIAVTRNGIVAAGRKFYSTSYEDIVPAASPFEQELGRERTFTFAGKRFYLAVCYDSFGLRHWQVPNHNIDAAINLVHYFAPPGETMSGSVDYARKGLAGLAYWWDVPVFAAAVFGRDLPPRWPTAIRWDCDHPLRKWCYADNPLVPAQSLDINYADEDAHVRIYLVGLIWPT